MYSSATGQARVDRFVAVFALLLVIALVGMLTGHAALVIAPISLLALTLTLLAVLGPDNRWPDRATLFLVCVFHTVSIALWAVALGAIGDETPAFAGMPLSTGILTLVAWPVYALLGGPVYAFCAVRSGLVADVASGRAGAT
ncbi:hypothetical protein [Pseudonocardia sp. KRD291]|uniref:hypothetical protein n=1 Tax=Pseudonocardia sp. KRD291 TaxID=2792007 RepID=UPI001C49DA3E|nr:hypothetical protein [Pseudonocardia sp. KRD291]MBW0101107.1 hypothetical protein [Pseudonocardia sp. KRD291]